MTEVGRYTVRASSLGNYFGVGYETPEEQLYLDINNIQPEFDEASKERMKLGELLEDSVLDFFQYKLDILITERNQEIVTYKEMLRCKIDGRTTFNGEDTIVECKVSNSASTKFYDNKGYYFQIQAYMAIYGAPQALLLGLQNGKPVYRLFKRDEECIKDIEEMLAAISSIFFGFTKELPYSIIEKYSSASKLEEVIGFEDKEEQTYIDSMIKDYAELSKQKKEIDEKIDSYKNYLQDNYKGLLYTSSDKVKVTVSERAGRTTFDKDALIMDYPTIDLSKYETQGSSYTTVSVRQLKK